MSLFYLYQQKKLQFFSFINMEVFIFINNKKKLQFFIFINKKRFINERFNSLTLGRTSSSETCWSKTFGRTSAEGLK